MNLNVVYELRDRLKTAAVAGTGLMEEDFRLRRAVEQMAPLAKASPVFARVCQMAEKTLVSDCDSRTAMVLDTLALVDAVLCTQGGLLKEGQWKEIPGREGKQGTSHPVPYSLMAPVLEAFRGTGSGRYAVLRDAHDASPEIFKDYRLKQLMVRALGDSYGELADMVAKWLKEEDAGLVPLLKQDFDPAGRREMVRRVEVLEAIAGKEENAFYLEMLPAAQKEVKEALIRALRHEKANETILEELAKTEKGAFKKAALYALEEMKKRSV